MREFTEVATKKGQARKITFEVPKGWRFAIGRDHLQFSIRPIRECRESSIA